MPMAPFFRRFPELAATETRSAQVGRHESLPPGEYGFVDLYCDEVGCDCRRVLLTVIRAEADSPILASVSFGWEDPSFYHRGSLGPTLGEEMAGPFLDPLAPQSRHAPALLELSLLVLSDPLYVARLKQHYRMFKEALTRPERKPKRPIPPKRRRNRPKGRGS